MCLVRVNCDDVSLVSRKKAGVLYFIVWTTFLSFLENGKLYDTRREL